MRWLGAFLCVAIGCAPSSNDSSGDGPSTPPDVGSGADGGAADASSQADGGAVTIVRQFDGDHGPGLAACQVSGGHCDRPDGNIAANGTQVLQATWQNVNVYDYAGNLVRSTPMPSFITAAGLSAGKPIETRVVFDEFIQRWIVTTTCAKDCLLVSATADATGPWAGIYIANYVGDASIRLGYDKNGVYLSEYIASGSDPNTQNISLIDFAIPSAEMKWTSSFAPAHVNRSQNTPLDGMPIIDHTPTKAAGDPAFFLAKTCPGGSCQNDLNASFKWIVTTVTWSGTAASFSGDQLVMTEVGSTQNRWIFNKPLDGLQSGSGTTYRLVETHRVENVIQRGHHLYGVMGSGPCTSGCGAQGTDSGNIAFWTDLDCTNASACTVAQTGKIASASESYAFPTIGVDSNGNIGIAAAALSSTQEQSIRVWRHLVAQAPGSVDGPTTVIDGLHPYTCVGTQNSFANAIGLTTVQDPVDGTKLWTWHQYASSPSPCVWGTRLFEVQLF